MDYLIFAHGSLPFKLVSMIKLCLATVFDI